MEGEGVTAVAVVAPVIVSAGALWPVRSVRFASPRFRWSRVDLEERMTIDLANEDTL